MTDPQSPAKSASGSSLARILLVDDDRPLRAAIQFNLEDAGYTVVAADDPRSALALIADSGPIDLVVTDLMLPHMSGADLVRELRTRVRDVPAIIISGLSSADARTRFALPANSVFLEKIATPRMLLPTIAMVLAPPIRPHLANAGESTAELRA